MPDQQATPTEQQPATDTAQQQPDISTQLGNALWTGEQPKAAEPPVAAPPVAEPAKDEFQYVDPNDWLKQTYGWENVDAGKKELEELRKLKESPQAPAEHKFANEESRKYYDAVVNGKGDDLYNILHQQKQLERLEKLQLASTSEAEDILRASWQYKYPDLASDEIDLMLSEKYPIPAKPVQGDQDDADYQAQLANWQQQVQRAEKLKIIDAKLARLELAKYKSELVLPDIPKAFPDANQQVSQEDLAAQEAFRNNFAQQLKTDTKFKGFNVMAKDGDVELPINYLVSDEEKVAFNEVVQRAVANISDFLDNELGWWDKDAKSFNVGKMQEDLYLLMNRGKVHQKIANESATQRFLHQQKVQNNINIKGVNNGAPPVSGQPDTKAQNQQMAEFMWNL